MCDWVLLGGYSIKNMAENGDPCRVEWLRWCGYTTKNTAQNGDPYRVEQLRWWDYPTKNTAKNGVLWPHLILLPLTTTIKHHLHQPSPRKTLPKQLHIWRLGRNIFGLIRMLLGLRWQGNQSEYLRMLHPSNKGLRGSKFRVPGS